MNEVAEKIMKIYVVFHWTDFARCSAPIATYTNESKMRKDYPEIFNFDEPHNECEGHAYRVFEV